MRFVLRSRTVAVLALASLAGSAVACKKDGPSELPLCKEEVAGKKAEEVASGTVPPGIWFQFLLKNFDRNTMTLKTPAQDCTGRMIEPKEEQIDTCIYDAEAQKLPERPRTEDDLLIEPLDDGRQLVWAKTAEFDNGEAVGPIAITEWTSRGVVARAIGTLRAQADRASIRLETVGADEMLVVESRRCDPDDPKNCSRRVRLVPLSGDMFTDKPLRTEDGTCIGAAEVTNFEEKTVTLDNGIERSFEVARSVDFEEGAVVINEQVTIKDKDPTQPDLPAKLFRRAVVQRVLNVGTDAIVTSSSLWEDMISEHGSVEVKPEPEPAPDGDGDGDGDDDAPADG
ncbi:MAG: hypothetical protein ACE37F_31370 [Nannocystaceae bacterium]|nr:hypothetical protein [bacterium]